MLADQLLHTVVDDLDVLVDVAGQLVIERRVNDPFKPRAVVPYGTDRENGSPLFAAIQAATGLDGTRMPKKVL